jgi:hypothetical protein
LRRVETREQPELARRQDVVQPAAIARHQRLWSGVSDMFRVLHT